MTNNYALVRGFQHTLYGFQLIWDASKNRLLLISEMAALKGITGKVPEMKGYNLTFIENSASELVVSVREMLDYLDNKLQYSEDDLFLLSQFNKALVKSGYPPMLKNHSQPCISFLRNHKTELFWNEIV